MCVCVGCICAHGWNGDEQNNQKSDSIIGLWCRSGQTVAADIQNCLPFINWISFCVAWRNRHLNTHTHWRAPEQLCALGAEPAGKSQRLFSLCHNDRRRVKMNTAVGHTHSDFVAGLCRSQTMPTSDTMRQTNQTQ